MGKFIKNAFIFVGGMAAGVYCITTAALKSKTFTETLKETVKRETADVINRILYGSTDDAGAETLSYRDYYKRGSPVRHGPDKISYTHFVHCDNIIFECREEAEAVLDAMNDVIRKYGIVTVADFYDLAELGPTYYSMNNYGWSNIAGAKVARTRDGYHIKLPIAVKID